MNIMQAFGLDGTNPEHAQIIKSYQEPDADVPRETLAFLVGLFQRARTIGVTYTLTDLAAMHPVEREAARLAGERHGAAQALLGGRAGRGGLDAAAVAAILDGGELLQQALADVEVQMLDEVKHRTTQLIQGSIRNRAQGKPTHSMPPKPRDPREYAPSSWPPIPRS